MEYWKVPNIWSDSTAYIIGGGISIRYMVGIGKASENKIIEAVSDYLKPKLENKRVIGLNKAILLGEWIDIIYFGDSRFLEWQKEDFIKRRGLIVSCVQEWPKRLRQLRDQKIKVLKRAGNRGVGFDLDKPKDRVGWFGNTGASAIHLAILLGAKRIVLLGYDCKMNPKDKRDNNWHLGYPGGYMRERNEQARIYHNYNNSFGPIARDAEKYGIEVLNATPDSALNMFPLVDFESELVK